MTQRTDRHDPRVAVKMARHYRGQTQEQLAAELAEATGEPWSRAMIGKLETGGKVLDVQTLMLIAEIHDLPISFYLEPPERRSKGVYVRSARQVATAAA